MAAPNFRIALPPRKMLILRDFYSRAGSIDAIGALYDPRFWKSFTKIWMDQPDRDVPGGGTGPSGFH